MWSTGEGNGKPLQYSCLENPMNSMKKQNDRIPKEELSRSLGAQYATGDQWRNNSRKKLPLSTAFTVSHRFWVVVFSFSFVSMHILIIFYFFYDLLVIQQCVVQPPYVGSFNSFSPVIET